MASVRIPAPDIEEDVSAGQVTAYLLRSGSGWVEYPPQPAGRTFYAGDGSGTITLINEDRTNNPEASLIRTIAVIARAEQRHPSAVLADIVGPAMAASVGRECEEPGMVAVCDHCGEVPWLPRRARKARPPCPHVETAEDSAAHGAGESEEQKR